MFIKEKLMNSKDFELRELYNRHSGYLAPISQGSSSIKIEEIIASFFCPGPFYYTILDSPSLIFDSCSNRILNILGKDLTGLPVEEMLTFFHPDDMPFVVKCEEKAARFLTGLATPDDVLNYKITYCYRGRLPNGEYALFSIQNNAVAVNSGGSLLKVLGVHTNISHITNINNHKISFIGLNGRESYLGLGVETNIRNSSPIKIFTKRELEVIRLLGEGLTALQIAEKLFVSAETIISHKKNAMTRNNCKNSNQLVALAIKEGVV